MSSQDGEDTGSSVSATPRGNSISSNQNFEFVVVKDEPQDDISGGEEDGLGIEVTEGSVMICLIIHTVIKEYLPHIWLYRLYKGCHPF
jgi:hypothetical protein